MATATETRAGASQSPAAEAWASFATCWHSSAGASSALPPSSTCIPPRPVRCFSWPRRLPMNELAALLACDNSNVTGLVDRLEARGLVTRQPSPEDRRVKHIVLTDAGRDAARPDAGSGRAASGGI